MLISIITVNYNNKAGLQDTLQSGQEQYGNLHEHIVVDGDSTDGSKTVIEDFKAYLSHGVSEPDTGIYNAMNKGIKHAKGEYLLFLNSGDTLYDPKVIEKVSLKLKDGFDIYYGDLVVRKNGNERTITFPEKLSFNYFFHKGYLPHPATFLKRRLFETISLYNENLKIASDWEFMVCAICKHKATYSHLDFVISKYEADGISSNPANKEMVRKEKFMILEDHFALFIDDNHRLIALDEMTQSNRFKMLTKLEKSNTARKLNSFWLRTLSSIFVKKK